VSCQADGSGGPSSRTVRYPVSFNEFSVHSDFDAYREKLSQSREAIMGIYQSVKDKVEPSLT
jgi:hypothetical protein